jgi:antitoxin component YwqK of YwqJK toxin-antitoxin module
MKSLILIVSLFGLLGLTTDLFAQDENPPVQERQFTIDTPITIDLEGDEEEAERAEPKKKKVKKGVYYGLKTKKGFTKVGFGDNTTLELFHYLKVHEEPDPYIQSIFWYDFRRKQIRRSKNINKDYGVILHGPYKKMRGEQVLEEGIYFVGAKHGRWMSYDRNDVVVDKRKFYKGWPKESLVKYYDEERTKLKEVIPVIFGKKEGTYYYFFENGDIAVTGSYSNDEKVGKWVEYYSVRGRRKKEIEYPENPWDKTNKPHILKEWDMQGRVLYDYNQYRRNTSS